MKNHDPYCKCYYPALTDPETCTWCYVIRQVRIDEYLQAWNEGFEVGLAEGKQMPTNVDNAINKWEEDVSIAYWQGYNNALIEKDIEEHCPCCKNPDIDYWEGYNNTVINKESDAYKRLMDEREKSVE